VLGNQDAWDAVDVVDVLVSLDALDPNSLRASRSFSLRLLGRAVASPGDDEWLKLVGSTMLPCLAAGNGAVAALRKSDGAVYSDAPLAAARAAARLARLASGMAALPAPVANFAFFRPYVPFAAAWSAHMKGAERALGSTTYLS